MKASEIYPYPSTDRIMLIAKEVELKRLQDECEEQEREAVSRLLKLLDIHALLPREKFLA